MDAPDFFNLLVQRAHNKPSNWQWYKLNCHGLPEDFIAVTGDVPCGVVTRGERKGQPRFKGKGQTYFIRSADINAAKSEWEQEHKLCAVCGGKGRLGEHQKCFRCNGTGKPKEGAV